ncbi:hypothetical protein Tco_0567525 [Tanacetum coccineum]
MFGIFTAINVVYISIVSANGLKNVPVPLDHFPINALTSKVFSFMVKKGKHFSGNVTPLFDSMLVQPTEIPTNPSPKPSPTTHIPDSIPEGSGGNHGGQSSSDRFLSGNEGGMTLQSVYDLYISLCTQVTDQAKEIKHLKAQIKKLKKKAKPVITHHKAWMKSGRKPAKAEPTVHKDPAFDELDDDTMDYMETEDAQDMGRTSYVVHEGTDKPKVSTDKEEVSTDRPDEGTVDQNEGRIRTRSRLKKKSKGVELKDVEETERPRPTLTRSLLTLKPFPKIDLKDKGKKMIEEEDESYTDSEDITKAEKKFKQLARDEDVARKERLNADKINLLKNFQEARGDEIYDETEEIEDVYLNVVIRSNRQRRYFSTLMAVLSILDRDDICAIYQLVMNRYQDETPEGFDKIL